MTTTRIDHTNCSHPRTPAGRRACRAAASKTVATKMVNTELRHVRTPVKVVVTPATYCPCCDANDPATIDGYTECCNKASRRHTPTAGIVTMRANDYSPSKVARR